jgi:hypothetical protein
METIIGFVVGYLVGSREGKAGLERLRTSANAIMRSPEVRRFAAEAITVAESTARQVSSQGAGGIGGIGGIGGSVARTLIDRVTNDTRREGSRAA